MDTPNKIKCYCGGIHKSNYTKHKCKGEPLCNRCKKTFSNHYTLSRHLNKSKKCELILCNCCIPRDCGFCPMPNCECLGSPDLELYN